MGRGEDDGGIPHGQLLVRFAEAVLGDNEARLDAVRTELRSVLGDAALVDTAAVAALFNAIDRVADATGIPMEDQKIESTADFRETLGINAFESMAYR